MRVPPRLAEWLVASASPPDDRSVVLADFRDEFARRVVSNGGTDARAWYWRETLRSFIPLVRRRLEVAGADSATSGEYWRQIVGDAVYALRIARRSPLASSAIIATIALSVGAGAAVYGVVDALLLRPLPFPASGRVVQLSTVVPSGDKVAFLAYPDAIDYRRRVPEFEAVSIFAVTDATLQYAIAPEIVHAVRVDEAYSRVFALRAAIGRLIEARDTVSGAPKVAVLSHEFWAREFGEDRSLVGKTIQLDNESVQVIGVLEQGAYVFPRSSADVLTPLRIPGNSYQRNRGALWAHAVARLAPAASITQARRDLAAVASAVAKQFPNSNAQLMARLDVLRDAVLGPVRPTLELLAAAIAAAWLVACINVANLILGSAQSRTREFAVRAALGGSRSRVRRQVVTEGIVLALIGGAIGLLLAPIVTHALISVYPNGLPRADEVAVNWRVAIVALEGTIAAVLLSALPAARRTDRPALADDIRDGVRGTSVRGSRRAGRLLIVTQVAASLPLLTAAGLLLQTFVRLERVKPGFSPRGLMTFAVQPTITRYQTAIDVERYYAAASAAIRAVPGVRNVTSTTLLPFANCCALDTFILEDDGDQGPNNPKAFISVSSPEIARVLSIPLLRGRAFTTHDVATSEHVIMLNDVAAKRLYPYGDAVGRLISWNGQAHWRVVGIVASTHLGSLLDQLSPVIYVPTAQAPGRAPSRYLVVRADQPPGQILAAARAALREIDPTIALTDVATMDERISHSLDEQRFRAVLVGSLGALSLVLAMIGIYSVAAYSVNRRTREIGIRMTLGEAAGQARRRVMADAFRVAAVGLAIGAALALLAGKWVSTFLVDVSAYDRTTLLGATTLLSVLVMAASYGPARRASRIDPAVALRAD